MIKNASSLNKSNLLQQPVTTLTGVGPQLAAKLRRLGLINLQDLLFHLPLRYSDQTRIMPIGEVQPQRQVVIEGDITTVAIAVGRRRSLVCGLQDASGFINMRFYRFTAAQRAQFIPGHRVRCAGEIRRGASGLELYHPDYEIFSPASPSPPLPQTLTPIYPLTEGISQKYLQRLINRSLALTID